MYLRFTPLVLHWLRVPPEPHPPHGEPASLRVFRAGKNLYRLRLARWGFTQLLALAGIIFWLAVFITVEAAVRERQQTNQTRVDPRQARDFADYLEKIGVAKNETPDTSIGEPGSTQKKGKGRSRARIDGWAGFKLMLVQVALWLPPWAFPVLWVLKVAGVLFYLAQLPITYLIVRLDYELRWFMVTDRSLRIRRGVWKISESTMSFANIQQVVVTRDPLQRLLGLADVRVQSAGGGGGHYPAHGKTDRHLGHFENVTNASEIRDLILDRLRRFRAAGLGDPDELAPVTPAPPSASRDSAELAAARELLAAARALRSDIAARQ